MPGDAGDTALIVSVPIAAKVVGSWRQRYDASASEGVPAHITVVYPFLPVSQIGSARSTIEGITASASPFDVVFERIERFPGVTWLAPDPAEPFVELTRAFVDAFPDHRPHDGQFDEIVPHLTVIDLPDDLRLYEEVHREFVASASGRMGFGMTVTSVHLIARGAERWSTLATFELGVTAGPEPGTPSRRPRL
jgi:2'-5' RNA ligase